MGAFRSMLLPTIVMATLAILLTIIAYNKGQHAEGYSKAWQIFYPLIPMFLFAFIVAGLIEVLLPKEWVAHWLGEDSGVKGIFLACIAGGLTPGGPFIQFPLVLGFWRAGVGIGVLVSYLTAWSLWAVFRMPLEYGVLGPKFIVIRLASTLLFPPLAGIIASFFFSKWAGTAPGLS